MIRRLIILLLIVGCDRYEYISDDKKNDKWFGDTYIKTVKEPDDSTMPSYVRMKILEREISRLEDNINMPNWVKLEFLKGDLWDLKSGIAVKSRGSLNRRQSQIYRDLKLYNSRDKQFVWKEADTIIYHWVKQDN